MHSFTDNTGRVWQVEITIGAVKRVKGILSIDLLSPEDGEPPLLQRLHRDTMLLIDTIFALLKPQAEAAEVSDLQFAEALGGEAAYAAYQAFMEELRDFFQDFRRVDLAALIEKQQALVTAEAEKNRSALEAMQPLIEQQTEKARQRIVESLPAELERMLSAKAAGGGKTSGSLQVSPD
jgi:hypothetical protein